MRNRGLKWIKSRFGIQFGVGLYVTGKMDEIFMLFVLFVMEKSVSWRGPRNRGGSEKKVKVGFIKFRFYLI